MALFLGFLIAMFVTMVLIPPLIRGAERMQFVDMPGERKVHTQAIPRIGGIAMVAGAVLPILLWLSPQQEVIGLLLGMAVIVVFGVWDDRCDLDYRVKFLGQLIAASIVVVYGGTRIALVPFLGDEVLPDYISIPLTLFVLLAITNAINLSDGLDGLAGGTTLLSLGMIALLGYLHDEMVIVFIALAVIGSILGFLRFNTYPARIFMGDGGSQFLGFSSGALAVMLTHGSDSPYSVALPVLLLGLPILDTGMVMVQRIYAGRSPFSPDRNHIHHRLLALGLDHYEAVFVIYIVQAALVLSAYFTRYQADSLILAIYALLCIAVIGFFRWAHVTSYYVRNTNARASYLSTKMKFLRHEGGLARGATYIAVVAIPAYLLSGVTFAQQVGADIGVLALLLLGALVVARLRWRSGPFNWLERTALYAIGTFVVYLMQTAPGFMGDLEIAHRMFYVCLAIVIVIGFRFSQEKTFRATPLDFLVIFIAFTVPNLPGLPLPAASVGEGIAKLIVLFYGLELILTHLPRGWDGLRYVMYIVLTVLGLRGVL